MGLVPAGGTANLSRMVAAYAVQVKLVGIMQHVSTVRICGAMLTAYVIERSAKAEITGPARRVRRNAI